MPRWLMILIGIVCVLLILWLIGVTVDVGWHHAR